MSWFTNVGRKIQTTAVVMCVLSCASAVIAAIATLAADADLFWTAMAILFGGMSGSVFSGWLLYGFGIIVEAHETNLGRIVEVQAPVAPIPKPPVTHGTWMCSCGAIISTDYRFCSKCGKKRDYAQPEGPVEVVVPVNGWKCSKCGAVNQDYVGTCGCGQRKP